MAHNCILQNLILQICVIAWSCLHIRIRSLWWLVSLCILSLPPALRAPRPLKLICGTKDDTRKRSAGQKVGGWEKAGKGLRRRPAGRTTLCFIAANPFQPFTTLNGPSMIKLWRRVQWILQVYHFTSPWLQEAFLMHAFTFTKDPLLWPRDPFLWDEGFLLITEESALKIYFFLPALTFWKILLPKYVRPAFGCEIEAGCQQIAPSWSLMSRHFYLSTLLVQGTPF